MHMISCAEMERPVTRTCYNDTKMWVITTLNPHVAFTRGWPVKREIATTLLARERMRVLECNRQSIVCSKKGEGISPALFALDAAETALVVIDMTKGVLSLPTVPYPVQDVLAKSVRCLC